MFCPGRHAVEGEIVEEKAQLLLVGGKSWRIFDVRLADNSAEAKPTNIVWTVAYDRRAVPELKVGQRIAAFADSWDMGETKFELMKEHAEYQLIDVEIIHKNFREAVADQERGRPKQDPRFRPGGTDLG